MSGSDTLSPDQLRYFRPLDRLTDEQLLVLASRAERKTYGPGQRVIERGSRDGSDYFLLQGAVELQAPDARRTGIRAGSEAATTAIARLQPRMYDVVAVCPSEFLVIGQEILNQLLQAAPVAHDSVQSAEGLADDDAEQQLLMEFYAELRSNRVRLPSVPDVAWKVRRAVEREDVTAAQVAQVISADPAIAAKLVRACNSPLYRGFSNVRNVREAVARLGMHTTRQLVTVFAMREIFKTRQAVLQSEMERLWRHSREVAALCWVLADQATGLDPEAALLAGLLHDIGVVPVLVQAEAHPVLFANEDNLHHAICELRADVGTAILESWGFPGAFVEAVRHAEDWLYDSNLPEPQLVDIVILAQMHAMIGSGGPDELPPFDQVPAYHRLGELALNASGSLRILTEARSRVDELQQLLSTR